MAIQDTDGNRATAWICHLVNAMTVVVLLMHGLPEPMDWLMTMAVVRRLTAQLGGALESNQRIAERHRLR
jgi:hypothetical protein